MWKWHLIQHDDETFDYAIVHPDQTFYIFPRGMVWDHFTGAGLAGLGKGGSAALSAGFSASGIPGMSKLMGFEAQGVNTSCKDILKSNKDDAGSLFGVSYKDLQKENNRLMKSGGADVGKSAIAAANKAAQFGFTDSMPKPGDVKQAANAASKTDNGQTIAQQASRRDPIVTSLGKVGGGGYATGALDAQRENNRFTGETNGILKSMSGKLDKLGGKPQAAFG